MSILQTDSGSAAAVNNTAMEDGKVCPSVRPSVRLSQLCSLDTQTDSLKSLDAAPDRYSYGPNTNLNPEP